MDRVSNSIMVSASQTALTNGLRGCEPCRAQMALALVYTAFW